ncbi:Uncharacterized conserved protein [Myxococcus fulvus]|uniref:Uncharacterized conserved protein n=1 Tax=Myxococcus fulvus TaxID=33 RepID=A0A511TAP9_MYXFU|nr:hypothetical protein [Myxococcus fulvus]GEN11177.1 hypothetical protein MFU01_62140 [Myxococcus fulvus]SEU39398.1 Uncharacterized conserved protein [Myxococcus fulvus]
MTHPPRSHRILTSLCVLTLALCSGCDDDDKSRRAAPPDASESPQDDAGTPDAGTPWDGTATPLEERGNWVDPGRSSACDFDTADASTSPCQEPSRFDVSSCDPTALAALDPQGIYMVDLRTERTLTDGGTLATGTFTSFRLSEDGTQDTMMGQPLLTRDTRDGGFSLVSRTVTNTTTTLRGCNTLAPDRITGCFARCFGAGAIQKGTFTAHRVAKWSGEPESSGGLTLLSETHVATGEPVDVYVARSHAYVVSMRRLGRNGGLSVYDVSDPHHPVFKTSISLPQDNLWNAAWAHGDALYIASADSGTVVYDISNPASPSFVRNLPSGTYGVHTLLVDGQRLYAMAPESGTFVYDVTNPLDPVLLTLISLPEPLSLAGPHDAFAYQGRLYISNANGGYSIMDVTDLEDVRHLGQFVHGNKAFAHHSAVGTFSGRTIAFEGGEGPGAHLRVLDVTDPAHIVKIGEVRKRNVTSIHNLILRGQTLYVAWYQEGLRVFDVSNPTSPRQVAHHNTYRETDPERTDSPFTGAYGVRVPGDGHVYVVDSSRGLLIFDEP